MIITPVGFMKKRATGVESTWCLSFDGVDDRVDTTKTLGQLATASTWSLVCWVMPLGTSPTVGGAYDGVFFGDNSYFGLCRASIGGQDRIWAYNWDTGEDRIGVTYTVGEWVHIAVVHSGGVLSLYKNGTLIGSVASGDTGYTAYQIRLGKGVFGGNAAFNGRIDDARVYSTGLTAGQVTALFTNTSPPTDVAAYLDLEEGTGTSTAVKDATGATIATATLTNGPTWHPQTPPKLVSGRVASARSLSFDGVDDYVIATGVPGNSLSSASMSFWFYAPLLSFDRYIVAMPFASGGSNGFDVRTQSGGIRAFLGTNNGWTEVYETFSYVGAWHHVAITYDGSNAKMFRDGMLVNTSSLTGTLKLQANGELNLGRFGSFGGYFGGLIDDPRIFSRALAATDVQKLCRGQNPTTNDPVGWWKLDETSGTTAVDSGSGGNNGTHVGGPTPSTDVSPWLAA